MAYSISKRTIFHLRLAGQDTMHAFTIDASRYSPDAAHEFLSAQFYDIIERFEKNVIELCDERQREEGHKFWYNAYWKTELAWTRKSQAWSYEGAAGEIPKKLLGGSRKLPKYGH